MIEIKNQFYIDKHIQFNRITNFKRSLKRKIMFPRKFYNALNRYMGKSSTYTHIKPGRIFNIDVDGIRFKMTFKERPIGKGVQERIDGRRESEVVAALKSFIFEGAKVLELGANLGYFTLILSSCTGESGQVVSVDASPYSYDILCENLRLNNITNVNPILSFISSKDEDMVDGVPVKKVTTILKENNFDPTHVVMDIEGCEVDVVDDLIKSGYLKKYCPILFFEVHPFYYTSRKDNGYIQHCLSKFGYSFRKIGNHVLCYKSY